MVASVSPMGILQLLSCNAGELEQLRAHWTLWKALEMDLLVAGWSFCFIFLDYVMVKI